MTIRYDETERDDLERLLDLMSEDRASLRPEDLHEAARIISQVYPGHRPRIDDIADDDYVSTSHDGAGRMSYEDGKLVRNQTAEIVAELASRGIDDLDAEDAAVLGVQWNELERARQEAERARLAYAELVLGRVSTVVARIWPGRKVSYRARYDWDDREWSEHLVVDESTIGELQTGSFMDTTEMDPNDLRNVPSCYPLLHSATRKSMNKQDIWLFEL